MGQSFFLIFNDLFNISNVHLKTHYSVLNNEIFSLMITKFL